jgi:hypothetical protein
MANVTYEALTGSECAKLAVRGMANLVQSIQGFNSRLITFPKLKMTISITVESWERETIEKSELLEFTERMFEDNPELLAQQTHTEGFQSVIDEAENPPDKLREMIGSPSVHPVRQANGEMRFPNPLPASEDDLSTVVTAGEDSPIGPHGGRVIQQEPLSDRGMPRSNEKLRADPGVSHFKVRRPGA